MNVDTMIEYLERLKNEGKGDYTIKYDSTSYNSANGGCYSVDENVDLYESDIKVIDSEEVIKIGEFNEYYSY